MCRVSVVIGSGRAWESSKADPLVSLRVSMARGKLECQCQLFWERDDRRSRDDVLELGDFNVITEERAACFASMMEGRQKKKRRRAKLYIKVSGGSAL